MERALSELPFLPSASSRHCSGKFGNDPASTRESSLKLLHHHSKRWSLALCSLLLHIQDSLCSFEFRSKCRALMAPGEGFFLRSQVLLRVQPHLLPNLGPRQSLAGEQTICGPEEENFILKYA